MIKKSFYLFALLVLFCTISINRVFSQNIPERPNPPRLVNDFAGMLKSEEVNMLEQKLVAFDDSTSTQIAIVIVPSLGGYDKADYSQRLGEKWGVGQKGKNNGVLILVKPKMLMGMMNSGRGSSGSWGGFSGGGGGGGGFGGFGGGSFGGGGAGGSW
jgi:uncharacterized protein